MAEPRSARYPFALTTGRLRDQWHGMSRTGTLGRLFGHAAEPALQLNPHDMERRKLADGDLVQVGSRYGSIVLPARGSDDVAVNQAFLAMHWGEEYLSGCSAAGGRLAGVNALTNPAFCPTSKQPELKHTPVRIAKAELPWNLLAMAWLPPGTALAAGASLRGLMARFPFASCVPFGRGPGLGDAEGERTGILFRAAAHEPAGPELLAELEALLGLAGADTLRYADRRHGQHRAARLQRRADGQAELAAFLLGGDARAEGWLRTLLQDRLPAHAYGARLLQPGATPPVALQQRGRQVCTCFDVGEEAIAGVLQHCPAGDESARLAALQTALKCGTNCGSCLPELRRMVRASAAAPQASLAI